MENTKDLKNKSLDYHKLPTPGKLEISSSKPTASQDDLCLAYSPGVAYPCLEIKDNPEKINDYTIKANSVGIITDGSAVLGLGNIGARASMPVMEGKAVLLKKFADINGIPLCISPLPSSHAKRGELSGRARGGLEYVDHLVEIILSLQANFGIINLEDIKAPECFEIEKKLQERLSIPVFHDDQHGTAIITLAAFWNSLELVNKKIENIKVIINGAGAAGIAIAKLFLASGVTKQQITLLDSKGVISTKREDLNTYKKEFAQISEVENLEDAIQSSDVFIGVSKANLLSEKHIKSMASDPIIFALANPDPEILPQHAKKYGASIIATGRSDYDNQVNNVLGFPGIFRGALDTRASEINQQMKLAAARALAELAKEQMSANLHSYLSKIYSPNPLNLPNHLTPQLIIPKPFDSRVVPRVARCVAKAAIETKAANVNIENLDQYEKEVTKRISIKKL